MMNNMQLKLQSVIRGCFFILPLCIAIMLLGHEQAFAHKPDRCFHKHYGGGTTCNARVAGKRCTDEDGNKGKCVQGGSYCYCKLFSKKKRNQSRYDDPRYDEDEGYDDPRDDEDKRETARKILELGIGIGNAILERERRRRDRDDEDYEGGEPPVDDNIEDEGYEDEQYRRRR